MRKHFVEDFHVFVTDKDVDYVIVSTINPSSCVVHCEASILAIFALIISIYT